ncbi:MAG TPA: TonB family protein [Longimicrobium sp.]|nr:TonB family protein [Longimicrobium sp.]
MFNKLVASSGNRKSFWTPTTVIASVGFHVLLGAGAYAANAGYDPDAKKADELVDYVEIEEEKKPEEPKPEEPKPEEPEPPKPEPDQPAPPVVKGFQEIQPPQEPPAVIPDVNPNQQAVKAEDFSGQGKAGGAAEGTSTGVAQSTVERETPVDEGVYDISAVEEKPNLSNRAEVTRALERNYPPLLRDAGVSGTVILSFRVNEDGRVDPSSITVVETENEQFTEAAKKVVERMRFRPAKVNNRPVKVLVQLPITFQPS